MGGGGDYYDRDVTSSRLTSTRGFSATAERSFERERANVAVLPKDRRLVSKCKSPVVYAFDVTGSMQDLPKIIYDKMPMIAGQLVAQKYLDDPMMSISAVGDVLSDEDPIQVADFSELRKLDNWLKRLCLEGGGGGGIPNESYEFTAYFYARLYEMKNAKLPIFLITGDEGFREELPGAELKKHFGGQHETVSAYDIFKELKKKFRGNVFLLRRRYESGDWDGKITAQWRRALGQENVIQLANDKAVGDTTLGIFAIASGARTLEEYLRDMRERPLDLGGEKFEPQSDKRIQEVRKSLEEFAESRNALTGTARGPISKPSPPKRGRKKGTDKSADKPAGDKPDWKV